MKQTFKAALAATVVLCATSVAHADLTKDGAVGLPLNPTAQIPEPDGVRVQANFFDEGTTSGLDIRSYGLFAAGRVGGKLELNGGIAKQDTSPTSPFDESGIAVGVKYLWTKESDPAGVRIAVGGGYNKARDRDTYAYVVASKYLGAVSGEKVPVTGHLGVRYDRVRPTGLAESKKASVFGGVEIPFTSDGTWTAVGELQSKDTEFVGAKVPYSLSVRYRKPGKGLSASLGMQRTSLTDDNGFFAQVGLSFGTH